MAPLGPDASVSEIESEIKTCDNLIALLDPKACDYAERYGKYTKKRQELRWRLIAAKPPAQPGISSSDADGPSATRVPAPSANGGQPPAKKMKYDFHDLIAIGNDKYWTYEVPRNLICARSKFVSDVLSRGGTDDGIICTPSIHGDEAFNVYIQLLYTGDVVLTEPDGDFSFCNFIGLKDLYKVAYDLEDAVSINLITDFLVDWLRANKDDMEGS